MTISLLGFAGLAALALGFLCYPLLRTRADALVEEDVASQHRRTHRDWYQQRVKELNLETQDPEARAALQQELAAVVLAETDAAADSSASSIKATGKYWLWYLGAGVLVISTVVYATLADFRLPLIQGAEIVLTLDEETQSDALNDWRERLQERLEQAPEDAKSWYLLGHAWLKLGQPNAAAQSFARTDALTVSDVSVKFYWLQARLLASNGELDRVSEGLANELLSIDPNNGPVLELLSVTMMQRGNLREAIRLMNRAITASVSIDRQIALAGAIGVLRSRMEAADPRVAVQISASTKPPDTAVVFVVARPPGGGMPYAAIRRPAAMLPFNVQLDDLVSMSEQRILSAAEQFEVLVRVSNQGIAKANPEDWVWQSEALSQQDLQNGKVLQALLQPD